MSREFLNDNHKFNLRSHANAGLDKGRSTVPITPEFLLALLDENAHLQSEIDYLVGEGDG